MTTREDLHRLVDELPENEIHSARRYLEYLRSFNDPILKSLWEAPEDDEPETEEERRGVEEAYEDLRAGRVVSSEEIEREFS
ncbi:MAG: hypothetical protein L0177_10840 [Chloroflexi bacterium]|nr:hypothetical protein [Chloroflexota bacterium]